MNPNLIVQLIDIAIAMAQTQLNPGETAGTLVTIAQRAAAAYVQNTGQPMNPDLIKPEAPL